MWGNVFRKSLIAGNEPLKVAEQFEGIDLDDNGPVRSKDSSEYAFMSPTISRDCRSATLFISNILAPNTVERMAAFLEVSQEV